MSLFNAFETDAGTALKNTTGALNKIGIPTPNLGLSNKLISAGTGGSPLIANAPYGLSPTPAQQYQIAATPSLSNTAGAVPLAQGAQQPAASTNTGAGTGVNGVTQTGGATATSGFGTPSYYLHNQTVNGVTYDLSTPAGQQAYQQAQLSNLGGSRDATITQLQQGIQNGLSAAQLADSQALGTYNQDAADYGRQLANNVVTLGTNHDLGQVNNQQYFAGLSPDAYQSGQGTNQQNNNNLYNQGLTALQQQGAENVGANYLTTGQIDPNSTLGKQIAAENNSYNLYTTGANQALQNGIQGANVAYQNGADSVNSNLQSLDAYAGQGSPTFQTVGYNYNGPTSYNPYTSTTASAVGGNPYTLPTTNISQYTPYATAAQLASSPTSQTSSPATWTGSGNPFSGLLGYTPTSNQSNYLNAFTSGAGATPATASGS